MDFQEVIPDCPNCEEFQRTAINASRQVAAFRKRAADADERAKHAEARATELEQGMNEQKAKFEGKLADAVQQKEQAKAEADSLWANCQQLTVQIEESQDELAYSRHCIEDLVEDLQFERDIKLANEAEYSADPLNEPVQSLRKQRDDCKVEIAAQKEQIEDLQRKLGAGGKRARDYAMLAEAFKSLSVSAQAGTEAEVFLKVSHDTPSTEGHQPSMGLDVHGSGAFPSVHRSIQTPASQRRPPYSGAGYDDLFGSGESPGNQRSPSVETRGLFRPSSPPLSLPSPVIGSTWSLGDTKSVLKSVPLAGEGSGDQKAPKPVVSLGSGLSQQPARRQSFTPTMPRHSDQRSTWAKKVQDKDQHLKTKAAAEAEAALRRGETGPNTVHYTETWRKAKVTDEGQRRSISNVSRSDVSTNRPLPMGQFQYTKGHGQNSPSGKPTTLRFDPQSPDPARSLHINAQFYNVLDSMPEEKKQEIMRLAREARKKAGSDEESQLLSLGNEKAQELQIDHFPDTLASAAQAKSDSAPETPSEAKDILGFQDRFAQKKATEAREANEKKLREQAELAKSEEAEREKRDAEEAQKRKDYVKAKEAMKQKTIDDEIAAKIELVRRDEEAQKARKEAELKKALESATVSSSSEPKMQVQQPVVSDKAKEEAAAAEKAKQDAAAADKAKQLKRKRPADDGKAESHQSDSQWQTVGQTGSAQKDPGKKAPMSVADFTCRKRTKK
ncbi:MAG: hypothetical protein Q9160_009314 [Pyrenula sp. 1 TL-2023]